jgi:subtilisin-like proprotein convertase family protein
MSVFYLFRKLRERWLGSVSPRRRRRAARAVRSGLSQVRPYVEGLEDRRLMSVLPPAVVSNSRGLFNNSLNPLTVGQGPGGFSPQVVVDPVDPTKLVAVFDGTPPEFSPCAIIGRYLQVAYSTNGGETWSSAGQITNITDPRNAPFDTAGCGYPHSDSAGVTFDRQHNFYTIVSENDNNPTTGEGAIVLQKFNFSGSAPTQTISNNVLYKWDGYDAALNPVIAVDNNLPSYTDPTTGLTQVDTMVGKAVYVAWNTQNATPGLFPRVDQTNPNVIRVVASGDGGQTFSTLEFANNDGNNLTPFNGYASPQIAFTQGTPQLIVTSLTSGIDPVTGQLLATAVTSTPHHLTSGQSITIAGATPAAYDGNVTVTVTSSNSFTYSISGSPISIASITQVGNLATVTTFGPHNLANGSAVTISGAFQPAYNGTFPITVTGVTTFTYPVTGNPPSPATGPFIAGTALPASPATGIIRATFQPGGQLVFLWNNFNEFPVNGPGVTIDTSQPDGGVAANRAADSVFFAGPGGGIADAIAGQNSSPDIPSINKFTITPNLDSVDPNANFDSVVDMSVEVSLTHPHDEQLRITLTGPKHGGGIGQVTLLANHRNPDNTVNPLTGAADARNLGLIQPLGPFTLTTNVPTIFTTSSARNINDPGPGSAAPFTADFLPEAGGGSLTIFDGLTRAELDRSTWTLTINDEKNDGNVALDQVLHAWGLRFTAHMSTTGFGTDQAIQTPGILQGNPTLDFPTKSPVTIATRGIGPTPQLAIDNTLGSFSPFQGRAYIAYVGGGSRGGDVADVYLIHSGDLQDPTSWNNTRVRVNDDTVQDGFSEGNRPQFMPSLAVDNTTGTLVITFYDARWDAAQARTARYIADSIDGGNTFGIETFLNAPKQAIDTITGTTQTLEPIPDNQSALGNAGPLGFGDREGLAVYAGHVYAVWAGNLNQNDPTILNGPSILTATTTIANGPRVVSSDQGPVVQTGSTGTYDGTFTSDGIRQLDGFLLNFDRPIDPTTFGTNDIHLVYRDTQTPADQPGVDISAQITGVDGVNSDALPMLSIGDSMAREGSVMVFTIILNVPVLNDITVDYTTSDGTAADGANAGVDYVSTTGTIRIPKGATSATISVPTLDDMSIEGNQFFNVTITNASAGALINRGLATGIIVDNSLAPALSINDTMTREGNTGSTNAVFTVYLSQASQFPVTVDYTTVDGTGKAGVDYTPASGTIDFAPGVTQQTIDVPVLGNTLAQPNRAYFVLLSHSVNASIARPEGAGIIVDDDGVAITAGDVSVLEGNTGTTTATFNLYLNTQTTLPVTVHYSTANGSTLPGSVAGVAGTDYTAESGTVTFVPGQLSLPINVPVIPNTIQQPNRNFTINLDTPNNASILRPQGTGLIIDDDELPTITVGNSILRKPPTNQTANMDFPVFLSYPVFLPVTVAYTTADDTATGGENDYAPVFGTLTFAPGQTRLDVSVPILGDTVVEGNEDFFVNLSKPSVNATIIRPQATGTIIDDNVLISVGDFTIAEVPNATVTANFQVFLDSPSEQVVTVDFSTANGTAAGNLDYGPVSGTLTFTPGTTVQTVKVPIFADTSPLPDETFFLDISNPTNGQIPNGFGRGNGTIVQPDASSNVSIGDISGFKGFSGNSTFPFTVFLSQAGNSDTTLNYTTVNGSASAGKDYVFTSGTVTIPSGKLSAIIDVPVIGNQIVENNKTFFVFLGNPPNGVNIARGVGTAKVMNDDRLSINIGDPSVRDGNNGQVIADFPVFLSNGSPNIVAVLYSTVDGTAVAPDNYLSTAGTLAYIPPPPPPPNRLGPDRMDILVPVIGNSAHDDNTTFTVQLTQNSGAVLNPPLFGRDVGTALLVDDDGPNLTVGDVTLLDGNAGSTTTATFDVYLAAPTNQQVTVDYSTADGTGVDPLDYLMTTGTLTFAPGQTHQTIGVPVVGTNLAKPNRTFTVQLNNAINGSILRGSGLATIVDDHTLPALTLGNAATVEVDSGTTSATFTVQLSYPSPLPVTVAYSTADDTAVAGKDYVATSGTLTFAPGVDSVTFTVPVLGTTVVEGNRDFFVNLGTSTNSTIRRAQGTGVIIEDKLVPTVDVSDSIVRMPQSGESTAFFNIYLSSASSQPVTVRYATGDLTAIAPNDYLSTTGSVTFAPGQTVATVSVPILAEGLQAPDRQFTLNLLSAHGANVGRPTGTGDIVNDDGTFGATQYLVHITPQSATGTYSYSVGPLIRDRLRTPNGLALSIGDTTVQENGITTPSAVFNVYLSGPTSGPVTAQYSTQDGTATAGTDYSATQGIISLGQQLSIKTLTSFNGTVTATTQTPHGLYTGAEVIVQGANQLAYDGSFIVTVTSPTTFTYTITTTPASPATGNISAIVGSAQIVVPVQDDLTFDPNETFFVNLVNPSGAMLSRPQGTATLLENKGATRTLSVSDVTVLEGNAGVSNAVFNVTLNRPIGSSTVTIDYFTGDGTAIAGVDYLAQGSPNAPGTLTFNPGQTTQQVVVPVLGNTLLEDNKTFFLNLRNPQLNGATVRSLIIAKQRGTGTVVDDDHLPAIQPVQESVYRPDPTQLSLALPPNSGGMITTSTLQISDSSLTNQVIRDLTVNLTIQHPNPQDLIVKLIAPDANKTTITLVAFPNPAVPGANLLNTTFDDLSTNLITQGNPPPTKPPIPPIPPQGNPIEFRGQANPPYVGVFRPLTPLSALQYLNPNGTWTLQIQDFIDLPGTGTLVDWSMRVQTGITTANTLFDQSGANFGAGSAGNFMDQNQNAHAADQVRDPGDAYAVPRPIDGVPFQAPYDKNTLPLIIPGPHVIDTNVFSATQSQINLRVPPVGTGGSGKPSQDVTTSTITVSGLPTNRAISNVKVNLDLFHQRDADLTLTLIAPDGTQVVLAQNRGGNGQSFIHTTFDDQALIPMSALPVVNPATGVSQSIAAAPFTGNFIPDQSLSALIGKNPNGTWTLQMADAAPGNIGTLLDWSIDVQNALVLDSTTNYVDVSFDRDMDPTTFTPDQVQRITGPVGPIAITVPVASITQSDGVATVTTTQPHGLTTGDQVAIDGADQAAYNGTFLATVTSPNTFTVPIVGNPPAGSGTITARTVFITPNPNGTDPNPGTPRTYRITFPTQQLSGSYSVVFGSGIHAVNGDAMDTNLNAGVDLLRGTQPSTTPTTLGIQSLSRSGSTATAITVSQHHFATGQQVVVTGANETGYDGLVTINVTGPSSFTYVVASNLPATATGNIAVYDPANTGTTTKVFNTTGSTPILPGKSASLALKVPANFVINPGTQLKLNITYPDDTKLSGYLLAPDGTKIQLFTEVGSAVTAPRANFQNTILRDAIPNSPPPTPIQNAIAPFNGTFSPQTPLDTLAGKAANGTYTLVVQNLDPNLAGTINNWSLTLLEALPGSGLGELNADQATTGIRIFTMAPDNPLSHQVFTAIGPTSIYDDNGFRNVGRISAIAVDPSDPSGNTVYVSGASGGVWRTTNFLTSSTNGPAYQPLTDFGPAFTLNIGSIAVFGKNNDPRESIIYAVTGEGEATAAVVPPSQVGTPVTTQSPAKGVGILRSLDGGVTWELLDSLSNYMTDSNGNLVPIPENQRMHEFVGTTGYKLVVDPKAGPNGLPIVYVALGGGTNPSGNTVNGGLFRSFDGGNTWVRMDAGAATDSATDVVLVPSSADPTTGNLRTLWAAMVGGAGTTGVWLSSNQGATWNLETGLIGNALLRNGDGGGNVTVPVANPSGSPNGGNIGRIVLATPFATNKRGQDLYYQNWLYALVSTPGGFMNGLYVTKDDGRNWTQIHIPTPPGSGFSTNNENDADYDPLGNAVSPNANYDMSLAVDPNNPNVVYIGGTGEFQPQPAGGLIRVDTTGLADPYAFTAFDNRNPDGGQLEVNTVGAMNLATPFGAGTPYQLFNVDPVTANRKLDSTVATPFLNLSRDPRNPFVSNATLLAHDVANSFSFPNVGFNNTGEDIKSWTPFGGLLADGSVFPVNLILGGTYLQPLGTRNIHQIVSEFDPITGQTRIILGDDQGVYTGVALPDGSISTGIGTASTVLGNRNGDLQVAQMYYGAEQPSILAAQIAGAFSYGTTQDNGPHAQSAGNLISSGNIDWLQPFENPLGTGAGVATDQTGSGTSYHYVWPSGLLPINDPVTTNFFEVTPPAGAPISRTTGLLQSNNVSGPLGTTPDPEWAFRGGSTFAVNPINNQQLVMSSSGTGTPGQIFRTTDQGLNWFVIGQPQDLGNTGYADAVAYGAPDPTQPAGATDNFIFAGTVGGHIFVTFTGGGQAGGTTNQWLDITNGDLLRDLNGNGVSPVLKITADPVRGTHDAFAVTSRAVYYNPDVSAANWVNITGNLAPTGLQAPPLQFLTALVADWRDKIPFIPVASLTSSGTTATVTTVNPHGFLTGQQITISGATEPGYNTGPLGATITVTGPNTFTYQVGQPLQIQTLTQSNGLVTVRTTTPHGLSTGNKVIINGATDPAYNGTYTIKVTGPSTFTYNIVPLQIVSLTQTLGVATATTASTANLTTGEQVLVQGATNASYNGTFTVTVVDATHFTFTVTGNPASPASGPITATPLPVSPAMGGITLTVVQVQSISETNGIATVTTLQPHGLTNGTQVVISGATDPAYNGTFPIIVTGANSFTYNIAALQTQTVTQSNGLVTVKTVNPHNLTTGEQVLIQGAKDPAYNGTYTVSVVDANTFTYTINANPLSPALGTITVTPLPASPAGGVISYIALPTSPATGTIVIELAGLDQPGTHPALYVGGQGNGSGGVFRTRDNGQHWTVFPDTVPVTQKDVDGGPGDGGVIAGGYLPDALVTDLNLSVGNLNTQSGLPDQGYATNTLVVTTYGRGQFAINLNLSDPFNLIPGPSVASVTPTIPTGSPPGLSAINVTFNGTVNPATFNTGVVLPVQSLTSSGLTATLVTAVPHRFNTGDLVTIAGANESGYDGTFVVTVTSPTTFTYTLPSTQPPTATGNVVIAPAASTKAVLSLTSSGTTATLTTVGPHSFNTGDRITIAGADQAGYDGTFIITVTGPSTFTYTLPSAQVSPATGNIFVASSGTIGLVGPNGPIPLLAVTDVSTPGSDGVNRHNLWQLTFPTQTKFGNYTLTIGPNVRDFAGHAMDQNGNGINGEIAVAPVGDTFVHNFLITGLAVQTTAALSSSPIQVQAISSPLVSAPTTITTKVATVTTVGPHGLTTSQEVLITGANESGYDGLFTITVTGPNTFTYVVPSSLPTIATGALSAQAAYFPPGPVPTPPGVTSLYVQFNTAIDPSTFDGTDVTITAPGGVTLTGITVTELSLGCSVAHSCFEINAPSNQLVPGIYSVMIGPNILDTFGNAMDQDEDMVYGQVPDDVYTTSFALPGVHVVSTTPGTANPVVNPASLSSIIVTFSNDIRGSSLTASTVTLADPNGSPVTLNFPAINVSSAGLNNAWKLTFPTQTTPGVYVLTVGPNVLDTTGTTGSPMDQDQDGVLGQADDQFVGDIVLQGLQVSKVTTLAGSTTVTLPNAVPLPAGLTSLTVNFNMAVDPTTLTSSNVMLTDPNGTAVALALPPADVSGGKNKAFRFTFPALTTYGTYNLTIGPGVKDVAGNPMNQNGNTVFGESGAAPAGDAYTTSFMIEGLQVTSPPLITGPIVSAGGLSTITLNFNMTVNTATLKDGTTVVLKDPNGAVVPTTIVDLTGPTGLHDSFQLTFTAQTTAGVYKLFVGPNVQDLAGNAMDQNENGIHGEPADKYTATFVVTGLQVTMVTPANGSIQTMPVASLTLVFNMAVDPTSLTSSTVVLTDPKGHVVPLNFPPMDVSSGKATAFTFTFPAQTISGKYSLTVGPNVLDTAGDAMNQNGNTTFGEPTDAFQSTFILPGVQVTSVTDNNGDVGQLVGTKPILSPTTLSSITINFSGPVDANTVNSGTVKLLAPNGLPISPLTFSDASGGKATAFTMSFPAQTTAGVYRLSVGPNVKDASGNLMDQNQNGIFGENPGDVFAANFEIDGLRVMSINPAPSATPLTVGLSQFTVTFNEAVDPTTLTSSTVVLKAPNGTLVPLTFPVSDPSGKNTTFRFTVAVPGGLQTYGTYTLTVGPNVLDTAGNAMNQNGNTTYGDPITSTDNGDAFVASFTIGSLEVTSVTPTPSAASAPVAGNPAATVSAATGLSSITFTFNMAVSFTTVNTSTVTLTDPSGNPIPFTLTDVSGTSLHNVWQLSFAPQTALGGYTLTVGPSVKDLSGRSMDQNQNGTAGEAADQFQATFTVGTQTVVVPPPPPPGPTPTPGPVELTGQLAFVINRTKRKKGHPHRFTQTVSILNTSNIPVQGVFSLVLDGLPAKKHKRILLLNPSGFDSQGSPFVQTFLNAGQLSSFQGVTLTLEFFSQNGRKPSYNARLFQGGVP